MLLSFRKTYIEAPEAAAADAAFFVCFLAWCFDAFFSVFAGADAAAAGAEACAKAAVANRPAIRAAISFFMSYLSFS
jgi:hypothetical protein